MLSKFFYIVLVPLSYSQKYFIYSLQQFANKFVLDGTLLQLPYNINIKTFFPTDLLWILCDSQLSQATGSFKYCYVWKYWEYIYREKGLIMLDVGEHNKFYHHQTLLHVLYTLNTFKYPFRRKEFGIFPSHLFCLWDAFVHLGLLHISIENIVFPRKEL